MKQDQYHGQPKLWKFFNKFNLIYKSDGYETFSNRKSKPKNMSRELL
jgi:hypothetical protein